MYFIRFTCAIKCSPTQLFCHKVYFYDAYNFHFSLTDRNLGSLRLISFLYRKSKLFSQTVIHYESNFITSRFKHFILNPSTSQTSILETLKVKHFQGFSASVRILKLNLLASHTFLCVPVHDCRLYAVYLVDCHARQKHFLLQPSGKRFITIQVYVSSLSLTG